VPLGYLFPYLPHQPGYHKRLKAAAPLLAAAIDHLARQSPGWYDSARLIDASPVLCGASRETVRRSELAGWAFALVLGAEAVPAHDPGRDAGGLVPGQPEDQRTRGRRGAARARRPHRCAAPRANRDRRQGLAGRDFEDPRQPRLRPAVHPPRPPRRGTQARLIGWNRQWIESVNDTLKGQLDLERHGGRTTEGIYARTVQRLLAMAACICTTGQSANPPSGR
jgi:hypothetical protein